MVSRGDSWDPAQYEQFERERSAPFFDLLDLVEPCPGGRVGPERYAELLHRLGYGTQHVRSQVYLHVLPQAGAVVDWVKGTLLTDYRRRLTESAYDEFLARYRALLISELPEERPYPFAFKRILLWGRL